MAKFWSIGTIRGEYQPESFTETQDMNVTDKEVQGNVSALQFKCWKPREIALSFVVNGARRGDDPQTRPQSVDDSVDPEVVWEKISDMVRPWGGGLPTPIDVVLAGWGGRPGMPKKAMVVSSSINRTHIDKQGRAVRATITMTLRELAIGSEQDVESAIAEFQAGAEEPEAVQGTPENPLGRFGSEIFPK